MSLSAPTRPAASIAPSPADEALLALVLDATPPADGAAAVRALLRLAGEGEAHAPRLLLALAHEAAVAASCREALSADEAAVVASHVLAALGRELHAGDRARTAAARAWLLALAAEGLRARAAQA